VDERDAISVDSVPTEGSMRRTVLVGLAAGLGVFLALSSLSAQQQQPPKRLKTAAELKAAFDAHFTDFDYLLGDWEFTSVHKQFGQGHGFWSVVRLQPGQMLDEFRIVDAAGKTIYVTTTVRAYNQQLGEWELVGLDRGTGLDNIGTGKRVGSEVHIMQKAMTDSGDPSLMRIRYYNIQPDKFSWVADQSMDNGKTWTTEVQKIEAKRLGPPRDLGPLARSKK
jgi:hypothetical protein